MANKKPRRTSGKITPPKLPSLRKHIRKHIKQITRLTPKRSR